MFGSGINFLGFPDVHDGVPWRVKYQQALICVQRLVPVGGCQVIKKLFLYPELPAGEVDGGCPGFLNSTQVGGELLDHVLGVCRGSNGDNAPALGNR